MTAAPGSHRSATQLSTTNGRLAIACLTSVRRELRRIVAVRKMFGEKSFAMFEDEVAERFGRRGERLGQGVDYVPATHDRQLFRFRSRDQVVIELKAHGVQRQQRDTHSGHDGLL